MVNKMKKIKCAYCKQIVFEYKSEIIRGTSLDVCSQKCKLKVNEIVGKNMKTPEYQIALRKFNSIKAELRLAKLKGLV
jgi:hypothetical protein